MKLIHEHAREIVNRVLHEVNERYYRPDVAAEIDATVRRQLDDGHYGAITSGRELAERLTADLRGVSGDGLLGVQFHAQASDRDEPQPLEGQAAGAADNFGFERAKRLDGNIGLLVIRRFHAAEDRAAADAAAAAMTLLAHTDALIIDLRETADGAASMTTQLSSFFFDGAVHLNTIRGRPDEPDHQHWTSLHAPGPRYHQPVYLLTSERTSGAAASFASSLQALGRATIVGEPIPGAPPLVAVGRLDPCFDVLITVGRSVQPRSGQPWPAANPDIAAPADHARDSACAAARQRLPETGSTVDPGETGDPR